MNTREQIQQAISDFQQGANGFDKAPTWQSDYVKNKKYGRR